MLSGKVFERIAFGIIALLVASAAGAISAADRTTLNFNPDWKFTKSDPFPGAKK